VTATGRKCFLFLDLLAAAVGASIVLAFAAGAAAERQMPDVTYSGPRGALAGLVTLRAKASARGARVVAVTFLFDGVPVGSDTTPPYALDLDTRLLARGRHRLRVEAVDSLAQRARTQPVDVSTRKRGGKLLTASPQQGLERALAALRRGSSTVRLLPGRYALREVEIGDGARLVGSGPQTVLAPPAGEPYSFALLAKGTRIRISDLTIDGGGPGGGEGISVGVFDGSSDVRLQRLDLVRVRNFGVSVWGAHADVSVQDSRIEGNGSARAGVSARGSDASRDASVIRTRIGGFRDYGILFAQQEYGRASAALHALALDNTVTDVSDPERDGCLENSRVPGCGTNEGGIWTGGVEASIIGNTIRRTRWDGIETVGSSTRTSIVANDIRETRTGIYVERSTNRSLVARNVIAGVEYGVKVEWAHGGGRSADNTFSSNRIQAPRRLGLLLDIASDGNRVVGNVFAGGARPAIILQGSSRNVVRGNRACGARGPFVRQQSAKQEDGGLAQPQDNRLVGNVNTPRSCG
jgi:parallel beta-helix repeat protein